MKKFVFLSALISLFTFQSSAQVIVGFQGGEPGNTWGYTSTGADATAQNESTLSPNIVSGNASLVVGGNTSGGSCIDGGSGSGPNTLRQFTFNTLDISTSSNVARTLTFSWGTRFPTCVGTGWDNNEDLIFTAYHDGTAQAPVTLAVGNNNAVFNIATNQFTWNVPSCVNQFYFTIGITTNRRDELLFIDDVKMTAPSLNAPVPSVGPISGSTSICVGSSQALNIAPAANNNTTYTWSGIPAGATFTGINNTGNATFMGINWGTAAAGTYTISVTPYLIICGISIAGPASTIQITLSPLQVVATGTATICPGESTQISASGATSYTWDNGLGSGSTFTVSPANTTTYTVTGTSGSCTGTASVTITVANGSAVGASASPNTICIGGSSTLTANGATTYTWSPANGLSATTGATVTATPTSTTTYTVTGVTGSCSSSVTITVNVTPPAPVTITPSATSVCVGGSVTLTASGATTFAWTPANGLSSTSGAIVTATPTNSMIYEVTGTTGNCTSTAQVAISVVSAPAVSIAASSNTTCPGNPVTLTASGATTYSWQPNSSLSATTGAIVTATPLSTTTYTVTGSTGSCSATATINISVAPATISVVASDNSICAGNSTTLTASGATSYTWQPATGLSATSGATVTATPSATTTYNVTGIINGCQASANVIVTVETPTVNAGNDITVCDGNSVTLNATGADSYSWNNGAVNGVAFVPAATQTYTVTGTSINGCTATDQLLVTVEAAPQVSFTSDTQSGCLPLQVQFTSISTGADSYNWNFDDGTSSTDANPLHTFYGSGCKDITLEVTSPNGCARTVTLNDYICTLANPTASFTVNPNELNESNPQANFINTSENATSWLWNFGDQSVSTLESPVHTFSAGIDQYVITLIAYNADGCMDSAKVILPFSESPVYYVPNVFTPDGNEMNQTFQPVFTAGFDPSRYNLEVFNRWGERIFESSDHQMGWDGSYNGTMMPDGIYIWKISFNLKNNDDKKIVKGHVTLVR